MTAQTIVLEDGGLKAAFSPTTASGSEVELNASVYPGEQAQFSFQVEWWEFTEADIEREFADLRSIIDQLEAQAHLFINSIRVIDEDS